MLSKPLRILAVCILMILSGLPVGYAGIFKCQNSPGQTVFQDRPCQNPPTRLHAISETDRANDKHFLWKATSGESTFHLLGSIHFGSTEIYPLAKAITNAYEASDVLVVEVNLNEKKLKEASFLLETEGRYLDGTTVQDHILPETWDMLSKASKKMHLNIEILQVQKPWLISFTLAGLAIQESGFSPKLGIDRYFITGATDKKPIIELESVMEQMGILSTFSTVDQDSLLQQTLAELSDGPLYFRSLLDAWQSGNASKMEELTKKDSDANPGTQRIYESLFTLRNHAMTDKLLSLAQSGGNYFVVVGAGHLVGGQGIVQLLKQRGFEISQL